MATVTKDTLIGDILDMDRDTAPYFLEMGMHCFGLPICSWRIFGRGLHGTWCRCKRIA